MDVGPDALDAPPKARSSGTFKIYNVELSTTKTFNIFHDTDAVRSFLGIEESAASYILDLPVCRDVASPENTAPDRFRRLLLDTGSFQ